MPCKMIYEKGSMNDTETFTVVLNRLPSCSRSEAKQASS